MLDERRMRELLDPLNHHHLLQLQQQQLQHQQQQQQQQQQSHSHSSHHRGDRGDRDRGGDRDHHRGDRDRGDRGDRDRDHGHNHNHRDNHNHRERGDRGDRDHHNHRERERERERDRSERHRNELHHHQQQLQSHHHQLQLQNLQEQLLREHAQQQQQRERHHHQRERERERERERVAVERERERERERAERIAVAAERAERERERELLQQVQQQQQQLQQTQREVLQQRNKEESLNLLQLQQGQNAEERKQFEVGGALPKGWVREEIVRKTGLSAGKIDVCYHSPNGKKFWSKPQLSRFLGDSVDLSTFDFRTGKVNNLLLRKTKKHRPHTDYSRGVRSDTTLLPPIRQTASIFKQPVTVHKTQKLSTVKVDFKHGHQDKPKQLFWEKRLEGLRSCDISGQPLDSLDLPKGVEPVGPNINPDTVLQSVATALHVNGQPITGQTMPRPHLETNPGVFINPDQPLIQAVSVREDDIKTQEERVLAARKRLEDALRAYDLS